MACWGSKATSAVATVRLSCRCNDCPDLGGPAQHQHAVANGHSHALGLQRHFTRAPAEPPPAAPAPTSNGPLTVPPMTARRFCQVFRAHALEMLSVILDTLDCFVDDGENGEWPDVSAAVAEGLFSEINRARRGEHNFTRPEDLRSFWANNLGMALGAAVLEGHPHNGENMTAAHSPYDKTPRNS